MDDNASVGGDSLAAFQNPNATIDTKHSPIDEAKDVTAETEVVSNPQFPSYGAPGGQGHGMQTPGMYSDMGRPGQGGFESGRLEREKIEANERMEKARIIQRLQRLNARKDFPSIQFSESDNISTLRRLNSVATSAGRAKMSIDLIKRATIFLARIMEGLCERFPNKYVDLTGYSEHLVLTISSFDALLYDVYEFYSDTLAEMSPLLTYIGAIGSNLIMYSISRRIMGASSNKKKAIEEEKRQAERDREDEIMAMLTARSKLAAMRQHREVSAAPRDARDRGRGLSFTGPEDSDNESAGFKSVRSTEPSAAPGDKAAAPSVRFRDEVEQSKEEGAVVVDESTNKLKLNLN